MPIRPERRKQTAIRKSGAVRCAIGAFHWVGLSAFNTEHIRHGIKPRRLIGYPLRTTNGTAREQAAVCTAVGKLHPLPCTGEHHCVLTDHISASQGCEADSAVWAHARFTFARPDRDIIQINAPALRCSLTEADSSA